MSRTHTLSLDHATGTGQRGPRTVLPGCVWQAQGLGRQGLVWCVFVALCLATQQMLLCVSRGSPKICLAYAVTHV